MTRLGVLIFALAMVFSSADGWAMDKDGRFTIHDPKSCGYYLDAYSRTTLIDGSWKGPHEFWKISGWINGWLSAYNEFNANGKSDILGGMTLNDAMRWMAAWCRDNPSKDIHDALDALIRKLER